MSETPKEPGDRDELRDPTAPGWTAPEPPTSAPRSDAAGEDEDPGDAGASEPTERIEPGHTQHLPPPPPGQQHGAPAPGQGREQPAYGPGRPGGQPPVPRPGQPYAGQPGPGQPYPPQAGQPPYGRPSYGQAPYGQGQYGQPPYGQGPYGQNPYAPVPQQGGAYASPYGSRGSNGSAIALVVVAGISTFFGCIFAIPAVILGIIALTKHNDSPAEAAKFTRWGWIAWVLAIALALVIGVIVGLAFWSGSGGSGYGY